MTLVKVLSGNAVVWYDGSEITGISFGPNTTLDITGSVLGDIVGNLTASGRLSDSDHNPATGEDGNVLLPNNLLGLTVHPLGADPGSIAIIDPKTSSGIGFSIITGGSVSNVDINFALGGIYAGDGVFHAKSVYNLGGTVNTSTTSIDVNPIEPGVQSGFSFSLATQADPANSALTPGAFIRNVAVGKAFGMQLISGGGSLPGSPMVVGNGPAGGSISSIQIDTAEAPNGAPLGTKSYQIIAGDGASGTKGGGAGGSVIKVIEKASGGFAEILAGTGGVGSAGPGGAGGSILGLDLQSNATAYKVLAGDGAQGTPGGAGGSVIGANFANRNTNSGLIFTGDFTGDGILDVAVIDGGTGRAVVAEQVSPGVFDLVTQYIDQTDPMNPVPVKIIASAGSLPSDGMALDFNGDGALDFVVAYKGSNSVSVFLNQGGGSFYDVVTDPANPALQTAAASVTGSPTAIDLDPANPDHIVIGGVGEVKGKQVGTLEILTSTVGADGKLTLAESGTATNYPFPITGVVVARVDSGFSGIVASASNGAVFTAAVAQQPTDKPVPAFTSITPFATITGGVRQLEISSEGGTLATLATSGGIVTLFDATGSVPVITGTLPPPGGGTAAVIRFVDDGIDGTPDNLFVLSNGAGASRLTVYAADTALPPAYSVDKVFNSNEVFRNFAGFGTAANPGFGAITGALNFFAFSSDFTSVSEQAIPFSGKTVAATAGNGGNGVDLGAKHGNGGAGGSISSVNIEATKLTLIAGAGGSAQKGAGGKGGSLSNPASFLPASGGGAVIPRLVADDSITITAGNGGAPGAADVTAAGGDGGSMTGLTIDLGSNNLVLTGGVGGNSLGGRAGAGGSLSKITTTLRNGSLSASGGAGGNALGLSGNGGAGGAIVSLTHTLTLADEVEMQHKAYDVTITAGAGGSSVNGLGGLGGALTGVTLDLDNSNIDEDNLTFGGQDGSLNPVTVSLTAGKGGDGTTGAAGGGISRLSYTSHHDQVSKSGGIILGYFTMTITGGDGGTGSIGAGGNGGSFAANQPITGITGFDPDGPANSSALVVTAGVGGNGKTSGGIGGSIRDLEARNARFFDGSSISGTHLDSASITAGRGGDAGAGNGGAGGLIATSRIAVSGGSLDATAGAGGNGTGAVAKGGAGGSISGSSFGLVISPNAMQQSYRLTAGRGGDGVVLGGAGGGLLAINANLQQESDSIGGLALLTAGDGGLATAVNGRGGSGGNLSGITQLTGLNSVLTGLYAGNGGNDSSGFGGTGGSVLNVKVAGLIGRASDSDSGGTDRYGVFANGVPQGVFAGRAGSGSSAAADGVAGSVIGVSARQIAAIAALSGTPGMFVPAAKVANVSADLIGYDIDLDGICDDSTNAPITNAAQFATVTPADGFILAKAVSQIIGLHPFTFVA